MKKFFRSIRDKIRDYFFLDFYLDKEWTFRFKLMNFISGGTLLDYFVAIRNSLINAKYYIDLEEELHEKHAQNLYVKRAKMWVDRANDSWHKTNK